MNTPHGFADGESTIMRLGAVLYVYKGEHGLPSIDFECLRALCLIQFTRCPVKIQTKSGALRFGAAKLPYLQIGNEKFIGYMEIKELLDKEGYPIDGNLKPQQKLISTAYTNNVFNSLHAYYNYYMFGEPLNADHTRAIYAKRTPFPFSFYSPGTYIKEATEIVDIMGGFNINGKVAHNEVEYLNTVAIKCINMLSKKLGEKVWFFGDFYSELDVIVYAYLSVLYCMDLKANPLQNHIKSCQNLVNFINRIWRDVFKQETFSGFKRIGSPTSSAQPSPVKPSFMESDTKTTILAGIVASIAMGFYAIWKRKIPKIINGLSSRRSIHISRGIN